MAWDRFFDKLVSSHVGSLPLDHSRGNFEKAFRDLAATGVDVPPVPQLRDFVSIYLDPLVEQGVLERRGGIYVAVDDELERAARVKPELPELEWTAELARRTGVRMLRVPITGAFTLASRIYVGEPSRGLRSTVLADPDLVVEVMAEYVANVVREAVEVGRVVVIDEPMLGNIVGVRVMLFGYTEELILEAYARELKPAYGVARGTHVCGRVNERLAAVLAESERLDFLNHEFHDTPANLSLPWRNLLERGDKFLSPGVFSSKNTSVESVEEIARLGEKIASLVGVERVNLFTGDCGLGGLKGRPKAYEAGMGKLRNLAKAVELLNGRLLGGG